MSRLTFSQEVTFEPCIMAHIRRRMYAICLDDRYTSSAYVTFAWRVRSFNVCAIANVELSVQTFTIPHSAYIVRMILKMGVTATISGCGLKNFTHAYVRVSN